MARRYSVFCRFLACFSGRIDVRSGASRTEAILWVRFRCDTVGQWTQCPTTLSPGSEELRADLAGKIAFLRGSAANRVSYSKWARRRNSRGVNPVSRLKSLLKKNRSRYPTSSAIHCTASSVSPNRRWACRIRSRRNQSIGLVPNTSRNTRPKCDGLIPASVANAATVNGSK